MKSKQQIEGNNMLRLLNSKKLLISVIYVLLTIGNQYQNSKYYQHLKYKGLREFLPQMPTLNFSKHFFSYLRDEFHFQEAPSPMSKSPVH